MVMVAGVYSRSAAVAMESFYVKRCTRKQGALEGTFVVPKMDRRISKLAAQQTTRKRPTLERSRGQTSHRDKIKLVVMRWRCVLGILSTLALVHASEPTTPTHKPPAKPGTA